MCASAQEIIAKVKEAGGRLQVVDGHLEYTGPRGVLTDELRRLIRRRRASLKRALSGDSQLPAHLVAGVCDRGHWLALEEDGRIRVERHEGAAPLPGWLLDQIQAAEEELAAFMRRPVSSYTSEEKEALGLSPTFGTGHFDFPWWETG